jgi:hypothetical protein
MAETVSERGRKFFSVAEANAALPLVRAIVTDITELARQMQDRQQWLSRPVPASRSAQSDPHREELQADFERQKEQMQEYLEELEKLGVELKDYQTGLIDFPAILDNREVYLCWRLGEPEVAYWHELKAGFAGRKKLLASASGRQRPGAPIA